MEFCVTEPETVRCSDVCAYAHWMPLRLHRAICRALSTKGKVGKCRWTEDADGAWSSACGQDWQFESGGPKENLVRFCHFCGKRVEIRRVEEGEDD
jgi:hypothetical protein